MIPPPATLDGARVLFWSWSDTPFFLMPCVGTDATIPIHGLAVCSYEHSGSVYRFSCNAEWKVENDAEFASMEGAMSGPSGQYDVSKVVWNRRL